jgi:putative flippase GtrA
MSARSPRAGAPLRFVLLSVMSFTLNLGVTAGVREGLGASPEVAFAVGILTVFTVNFTTMRWWVFPGSGRSATRQLTIFALTSLVSRSTEYAVFLLLIHVAGVFYLAAAALTLIVSMIVKYFVYGSWLFAEQEG